MMKLWTLGMIFVLLITTVVTVPDDSVNDDDDGNGEESEASDNTQPDVPSTKKISHDLLRMQATPRNRDDRVELIENTYMIEFAPNSDVKDHFQRVTDSLQNTHKIQTSAIKKRLTIDSSLFSAVSISVSHKDSLEALGMIKDAVAIHRVHKIHVAKRPKGVIPAGKFGDGDASSIIPHHLMGVSEVHKKLHNYGKDVRVAIIDSGVDYTHPALGGCFGPECKVAFGQDLVGDAYDGTDATLAPDGDPMDNCSLDADGTHFAGIIIANTSGITDAFYTPFTPFIGVAPHVKLGAYRVFGCDAGSTSTDIVVKAIMAAYEDKADIISVAILEQAAYPDSSFSTAIQRVTNAGVYVITAFGDPGNGGLYTPSLLPVSPDAMAVASVDNTHTVKFKIIAPDGKNIHHLPGQASGGWESTITSTIVINDPSRGTSDGCNGPSKVVKGSVVLFVFTYYDTCGSAVRCDLAAKAGATGCLVYNVDFIAGSSSIPSGSLTEEDGLSIVKTVAANPSAVYTFTNILEVIALKTALTPTYASSLGLTGDLAFKPQISAVGGYIYSTISSRSAAQYKMPTAYGIFAGTSSTSTYLAGTLALFLASIGNPAPSTVNDRANNRKRRPKFSEVVKRFQSTAKIVKIYNSPLYASVAQQGAGLVNAYKAITTTTTFSRAELALNDTVREHKSYKVKVSNNGDEVARYKMSHDGAALATGAAAGNDQLLDIPLYSADYATVKIEPMEFEVEPGESREITLRFEAPAHANPSLLPIYSGFIYAKNKQNDEVVHMSYAGVVGNYKEAQLFVHQTPTGVVTGIQDTDGKYVTDQTIPVLNVTNGCQIIVVLAYPTRILFVDVVHSVNDFIPGYNPSFGLVYNNDTNEALYLTNVPRNVAIRRPFQYIQSYSYTWTGHVGQIMVNESSTSMQQITLPVGQYRIRFSALKHFGNHKNRKDFEVYHTPSFELAF